ncbi:MAG: hypothetical protein IPP19_16880 [Verrucomicrobia bacterium]|nr:hypothetical protein [Verrucomicrobiota bacterium]
MAKVSIAAWLWTTPRLGSTTWNVSMAIWSVREITLAPRMFQTGDAVVFPVDDGLERADGVCGGDRVKQFVHHLDVQRNLAGIGVNEVALGQQIEVRGDFVLADAGDRLGDQFLMLHLGTFRVCEIRVASAVDLAF